MENKQNQEPSSESAAKAQLEQDVAKLVATLNAERFCIAVAVVSLFDAHVFKSYNSWSSPLCLLAVELAGLFVLARRLDVDEVVHLTFQILKSWRGNREIE